MRWYKKWLMPVNIGVCRGSSQFQSWQNHVHSVVNDSIKDTTKRNIYLTAMSCELGPMDGKYTSASHLAIHVITALWWMVFGSQGDKIAKKHLTVHHQDHLENGRRECKRAFRSSTHTSTCAVYKHFSAWECKMHVCEHTPNLFETMDLFSL